MAVAPATRRASDRQRPCHPPLALAPRRLYTSPMRNPTSACPRLPDAARGISPRSTNCPETAPRTPKTVRVGQDESYLRWTVSKLIRSPKKKNLEVERIAGVPLVLRGYPREGRPLHNRHSRTSTPIVIPAKAGIQGGRGVAGLPPLRPAPPPPLNPPPTWPSRQRPVALATRRAATRVKPRRRCQGGSPAKEQSTRKAMPKLPGVSTKQTINPLCTFQVQKAQKKGQTIHRTITIKQPAAGGDPLRRRRTGATPSLCGALQCPKPHPRDTGSRWSTMKTLAQPSFPHPPAVIPAPTHRHPSTLPCMAVAPATGNPGRRGSAGHPPHPLPPQSRRAATASDRECDVMGPTR